MRPLIADAQPELRILRRLRRPRRTAGSSSSTRSRPTTACTRSGILHYHVGEGRFVGPRHDRRAAVRRARVPEPGGPHPDAAPGRLAVLGPHARGVEGRLIRASMSAFGTGSKMPACLRRHVRAMATAEKGREIRPASGKLGVLLPGMGAVATTFVAGVEAIRSGLSKPIGSLTQQGTIRLGKRTDNRCPRINEFVPLAPLSSIEFGGWDIFEDNVYVAAKKAGVLQQRAPGRAEALPRDDQALAGRVRSAVRQEAARAPTSRRARTRRSWPSRSRTTSTASRRRRTSTAW